MSDTAPYLQRNPGPDPVDVPAIPATVGPGETTSWHVPIAGFEPVPADTAAGADSTAPDPLTKTSRTRTAAASEE